MADVLIDSYSESHQAWYFQLTNVSGYPRWGGQSFTGKAYNISKCTFFLKKVNSPTGLAYAELYAHTGTFGTNGKPTGSPLATSESFDVETLTTSFALIDFTFTESYTMVEGTKYCIVLRMDGGTTIHQIAMGTDNSTASHSGNGFSSDNGSSWITYSSSDAIFYVYGTAAVTSQILKVAGVAQASIKTVYPTALASIKKLSGVSN